MANLQLSMIFSANDRSQPVLDGRIRPDGIDLTVTVAHPSEIFWRQLKFAEFDVSEMSMSSLTIATSQGPTPWVMIPVFTTREFFHLRCLVRVASGIKEPKDLKGKKVGLPEWQLTANVWARAILEDDHGVKSSDIRWIRGGIEHPGRPEKITVKLPPGVSLENAPEGATISQMLIDGEIDGFMAPRPPSFMTPETKNVGWLFRDPTAAAKDWFKRTGIFPIMHLIGIRRTLVEKHPYLPAAVFKAFEQSKAAALALLSDTSATKVTLPFVEERLKEARDLMGDDFWAYGLEPNRNTLEVFLRHHHSQGLSPRLVKPEELFHPSTHESFKL